MTAASPAAAIDPMATGSAATAARPQISARLPVSDWQIRWWLRPDGRTVLEVTDQAGDLTGLVASTRLPIVSVDGTRQRWALERPRIKSPLENLFSMLSSCRILRVASSGACLSTCSRRTASGPGTS